MSENYVERKEFEALKEEVNEIKNAMSESNKMLQEIERKVDVINQKLDTSAEINKLKIEPIVSRITKVENGIGWLWKLCATIIVTGIVTAVISFR